MDKENELYHINLNCWGCDHPTCRLGQLTYEGTKDGCVRQVNEELFIEYFHQLKEVWPFALKESKEKINKEYKKTMQILDKIYNSPCIKKYGKGFNVIIGI